MTPYHADPSLTVYLGDCREVMRQMEPESVHCVVTSPPYWGLRDYGVDGALGLEPTPEEFVANMVDVFREVKRVLRKDGTCWVNLGDSYATVTGEGGFFDNGRKPEKDVRGRSGRPGKENPRGQLARKSTMAPGLKPKDLVGIPWAVAFALQADGWYLRSDIIWAKPNPMPESVTDRPTKSHEYLFLLTKSARYYYDADAVRESAEYGRQERSSWVRGQANGDGHRSGGNGASVRNPESGRNLRTVWTIATAPYPGAHFATFPPKLVEPCIKAGAPEKVCGECGAGWRRVTEPSERYAKFLGKGFTDHANDLGAGMMQNRGVNRQNEMLREGITGKEMVTTGWEPSCAHDAATVPATVLDPFAGSGTTGMVAQSLSRRAVLIDLSAEYLTQLMARNAQTPLNLEAS